VTIPAYPLQWPSGWKRTAPATRTRAKFSAGTSTTHQWSDGRTTTWRGKRELTIAEAVSRVREQLAKMGVADDCVISTNLQLRLDGLPRSGQREPDDAGVAVYWRADAGETPRCMAIDRYDRVADNLAAIAATLDAMRAIERHGGAEILNRAFTGFTALPSGSTTHWSDVLGVAENASRAEIEAAYRRLRSQHHPDRGGDAERFHAVQKAFDEATA
jgi:hypothetical protein